MKNLRNENTENLEEQSFKLQFAYVAGNGYLAYRLTDNGTSLNASYCQVKEADLKKVYKLTEKEIEEIPNYVGFIMRPENDPEKYERDIVTADGLTHLNVYELPYHPKGQHQLIENIPNWSYIYHFLLHIAPNEKPFPTSRFTYWELMMDYLAIAWKNPTKLLPILALVSKERGTGKTTFLKLIMAMFQSNARLVSENDLSSTFNQYWGFASFVLVDEAMIPKTLMNKIRSESTSTTRSINAKYQQQTQIASFTKFAMASNEVSDFAKIDQEENRYFIIEVKPFPKENEDGDYFEHMKKELPAFLDYLTNHHHIQAERKTRMWFREEDIRTPALDRVVNESKSSVWLKVEEALQLLAEISSIDQPDNFIWEFALTSFRTSLQLNKGAETQIKEALEHLGVHSSEGKVRFTCAYSQKAIHAIKYSISVGELRKNFGLTFTNENMAELSISQPNQLVAEGECSNVPTIINNN